MIKFRLWFSRFLSDGFGQLHRRDYSAGWRGWLMLCLDSLYQVVLFIAVGLFVIGGLTLVLALVVNPDRPRPVSSDLLTRCVHYANRDACEEYNAGLNQK